MIERLNESVILSLHAAAGNTRGQGGGVEDGGEIYALGLPVRIGDSSIDLVDATNHFIDSAEAEFCHVLTHLLGNKEEEVDHVLGLACEARSQNRVLSRDADGASVQVTFAHHDAAHGDERHGGKAVFFGAKQRGDNNIATCLEFAIGLHADAAAQIVEQKYLLRFSETEFPGQAGVLDRAERGSTGAAAVT